MSECVAFTHAHVTVVGAMPCPCRSTVGHPSVLAQADAKWVHVMSGMQSRRVLSLFLCLYFFWPCKVF